MSRENVELVRATWPDQTDVVELVGDVEAPAQLSAALALDVEVAFIANAPGVPDACYRGVQGLAEGWRDWLEPYESYWLEAEGYIDAGQTRSSFRRVSGRAPRETASWSSTLQPRSAPSKTGRSCGSASTSTGTRPSKLWAGGTRPPRPPSSGCR